MPRNSVSRKSVERLQLQINKQECKLRLMIGELQRACKHPVESLRDCNYQDTPAGGVYRPYRLCVECGLVEQGWSFRRLRPDVSAFPSSDATVPVVNQQEIYRMKLGDVKDVR